MTHHHNVYLRAEADAHTGYVWLKPHMPFPFYFLFIFNNRYNTKEQVSK